MDDNIILEKWLRMWHNIESDLWYWLLTVLGKVFAPTTVKHVICTDLIDPDMIRRIKKFDEELDTNLDDMNSVDDVGNDFYIDDVDEAN